jgi:peptidoglycan/LPS O-acetylase OafA/YrhL
LNCEKCGNEIVNEKSSFCANCGASLNSKFNPDFLANTWVLSLIAAVSIFTVGVVSLLDYDSYLLAISYYGSYASYYGYSTSAAVAFLLIGGFAFVAAALGFVGATFSLKRKRFILTIIGPILMLASGIFTFVIENQYGFSYSDGFTVPAVPAMILSLVSLMLLMKSRKDFVDYRAPVKTPEDTMPPEESEVSAAPEDDDTEPLEEQTS